MPLILAEFCGCWGCTWQEGIINVFLVSLGSKMTLKLLCILLLPIFFLVLMLVAGLVQVYESISGWGRALLGIPGQTHLNLFDKNMKFCVAGKAGKLLENRNIFSGKLREFLF